LEGHPLQGKGLAGYTPLKVENSHWLQELERMDAVHQSHDPALWRTLTHYLFGFHDSTFECIAQSFKVEVHDTNLTELLPRVCARLIE
jgi:hypothetical protein